MTEFQTTLINDKETLWEIIKIYHPGIPEYTQYKKKLVSVKDVILKVRPHYSWVNIEFNVKEYGYISFTINNMDSDHSIWGNKHTLANFEQYIKQKKLTFRVWRFYDDCQFVNSDPLAKEKTYKEKLDGIREIEIIQLLKNKGYKIATAQEWFNNYYYHMEL